VESLYKELQEGGYTFEDPNENDGSKKHPAAYSNDPNVVASEEEEAAIAKAIAASLSDANPPVNGSSGHGPNKRQNGAYPTMSEILQQGNQLSQQNSQRPARQARVLYDFEAVEENELSLSVGELVSVLDDSDANWWRGASARGATGLFPASFVSFQLEDPNARQIQAPVDLVDVPPPPRVQIDEEVLLKCIQLLEDCDPTGAVPDGPDLAYYEQMSLAQAPLIDAKLGQIDKQHNMLAQIDVAIRDVLASYDNCVQQVQMQMQNYAPQAPGAPSTSMPPPQQQPQQPTMQNAVGQVPGAAFHQMAPQPQ